MSKQNIGNTYWNQNISKLTVANNVEINLPKNDQLQDFNQLLEVKLIFAAYTNWNVSAKTGWMIKFRKSTRFGKKLFFP